MSTDMNIQVTGDVAEFIRRLDPVQQLPTTNAENEDLPADAVRFARDMLDAADGDAINGSPRVLAASALYVAVVALRGPVMPMDEVAATVGGASDVAVRKWYSVIAEAGLTCDLDAYESDGVDAARERLEHLAGGGSIPSLPV